jgi:hypothetical protein
MRYALAAAVALVITACSSSTSSSGGSAPFVDVAIQTADQVAPHGTFDFGDIHGVTAVTPRLVEGNSYTIVAHPDPGMHVHWSGTDNDSSTSATNTIHAHAGQAVTITFSLSFAG